MNRDTLNKRCRPSYLQQILVCGGVGVAHSGSHESAVVHLFLSQTNCSPVVRVRRHGSACEFGTTDDVINAKDRGASSSARTIVASVERSYKLRGPEQPNTRDRKSAVIDDDSVDLSV